MPFAYVYEAMSGQATESYRHCFISQEHGVLFGFGPDNEAPVPSGYGFS